MDGFVRACGTCGYYFVSCFLVFSDIMTGFGYHVRVMLTNYCSCK